MFYGTAQYVDIFTHYACILFGAASIFLIFFVTKETKMIFFSRLKIALHWINPYWLAVFTAATIAGFYREVRAKKKKK